MMEKISPRHAPFLGPHEDEDPIDLCVMIGVFARNARLGGDSDRLFARSSSCWNLFYRTVYT